MSGLSFGGKGTVLWFQAKETNFCSFKKKKRKKIHTYIHHATPSYILEGHRVAHRMKQKSKESGFVHDRKLGDLGGRD